MHVHLYTKGLYHVLPLLHFFLKIYLYLLYLIFVQLESDLIIQTKYTRQREKLSLFKDIVYQVSAQTQLNTIKQAHNKYTHWPLY